MATKGEQARHPYEQDKPIHVPSDSKVNIVSAPSSLGMDSVRLLLTVQMEWQGNVRTRDIHTNKINQFTYKATAKSTTSVLRVRSEWNQRADYQLFK
jgi:hypothetical protein